MGQHGPESTSVARSCQFGFADLEGADLSGSDIDGAVFNACQLQGSIMTCLNIERASFTGAIFDDKTIWPDGFDPAKAGCVAANQ